jgi:ribonuclease HII
LLKRFLEPGKLEAGCDEAGRGCLAGPVCAAAVIMPPDYFHPLLNDSKLMTPRNRELLRPEIERQAFTFGVAFVDNAKIDEINILKASILAMHQALDKLIRVPDHILVDGNTFYRYRDIGHTCVIKGDSKYISIAAASVLAKTYRDELMLCLHNEFEKYGWNMNKGYPTRAHREAISQFGISRYHRRSFKLLNEQIHIAFDKEEIIN